MTRRPSPFGVVAFLALALFVADSRLFRAEPQAQNQQTLDALLVEVKGLRASLEQLAAAGPRVQLAFGRLQLHEQRINGLVRRLETVRDKMRPAAQEDETLRGRLARFEAAVKDTSVPLEERKELEQELEPLRRTLARASGVLQQLQAEEASVLSEIGLEQARWNDANQKLEELDRLLGRR